MIVTHFFIIAIKVAISQETSIINLKDKKISGSMASINNIHLWKIGDMAISMDPRQSYKHTGPYTKQ